MANQDTEPGDTEPFRVFISHKNKDKKAARTLQEILAGGCPKVEFFLSSDAKSLPGGKPWWQEIHAALDRADWLLLIYTTPSDNWDWCVYEAGYFAGRRQATNTHSLVVMHPPGVVPPAPLTAWQSVQAAIGPPLIFYPGLPRWGPDVRLQGHVGKLGHTCKNDRRRNRAVKIGVVEP